MGCLKTRRPRFTNHDFLTSRVQPKFARFPKGRPETLEPTVLARDLSFLFPTAHFLSRPIYSARVGFAHRSIMRSALLLWAIASLALPVLSAPPDSKGAADTNENGNPAQAVEGPTVPKAPSPETAPEAATQSEGEEDEAPKPTKFTGITVPVMKEIEGEKFDDVVKDGYWFVKHYSPYCGHCQAIAPTWQTLYEFYYVSSFSAM